MFLLDHFLHIRSECDVGAFNDMETSLVVVEEAVFAKSFDVEME